MSIYLCAMICLFDYPFSYFISLLSSYPSSNLSSYPPNYSSSYMARIYVLFLSILGNSQTSILWNVRKEILTHHHNTTSDYIMQHIPNLPNILAYLHSNFHIFGVATLIFEYCGCTFHEDQFSIYGC